MTKLYADFNEYPENLQAWNDIQDAKKNGTNMSQPYYVNYLNYIYGNSTVWAKEVTFMSAYLRKAQYVMIVQFLCALQTPLIFLYSFLCLGKIP